MSEVSEVARLLGEIKIFRDEFRSRLVEIDTLVRIADADEDSVLARVIPAADRSHIRVWRDNAREGLASIIDAGTIYELKQQDPYMLPEFTPDVFHQANDLAGELLQQLLAPEEVG